jgi:hypothetical protein
MPPRLPAPGGIWANKNTETNKAVAVHRNFLIMNFFYPDIYQRGANVQNLFDPMGYDLIDGLTPIPVKSCVLDVE